MAVPALVLDYMLFALLMVGIGALGNNVRKSRQFAAFVSLSATLPLLLGSLYIMNPNGLVRGC